MKQIQKKHWEKIALRTLVGLFLAIHLGGGSCRTGNQSTGFAGGCTGTA